MKHLKVLLLFFVVFMCFPVTNHSSAKHICKSQLANMMTKMKGQTSRVGKRWSRIVKAISMTESEGDSMAVSKCGRYVGYLQISKIMVRTCNEIAGYRKYHYNDRYNREKSIEMFIEFQERYNPQCNVEKAIRLWNTGDTDCMQNKSASEKYFRRVMKNYRSLQAA